MSLRRRKPTLILPDRLIMVREVVKVLNSKGIGKDRIHYDEIAVR